MTLGVFIDAVSMNWVVSSLRANEYFMQLMIGLNWITFSFLVCFLAIVIVNFCKKNKYKWLEVALSASLIVLLIVALIIFPISATDDNLDNTFLLAIWSSYMTMLFVVAVFVFIRMYKIFVYKKDSKIEILEENNLENTDEKKETGDRKKIKTVTKILTSVFCGLLIVACLGLPFICRPNTNNIDISFYYNNSFLDRGYCKVENNTNYTIKSIDVKVNLNDGSSYLKTITNISPNSVGEEYVSYNTVIESIDIKRVAFDVPRYDFVSYAMIPLILISGYFTLDLWLRKDEKKLLETTEK